MRRLLVFLLLSTAVWAQPRAPVDILTTGEGATVIADFAGSSLWWDQEEKKIPVTPWHLLETQAGLVVLDLVGSQVGIYHDGWQPWSLEVRSPSGIARLQDRLYLLERSGRLLRLNLEGKLEATLASELSGAEAVAAHGDRLYLSYPVAGQVRVFDLSENRFVDQIEDLYIPTRLDTDGKLLWVVESGSGYLWEIELAGEKRRRVVSEERPGVLGLDRGETLRLVNPLAHPVGSLRFELEDRVFVNGLSPVELDSEQQVVHAPLLELLFRPRMLYGFADADLDVDGNAYYVISREGRLVRTRGTSYETLAEGLDDPGAVLFAAGHLWVAETGAGKVWRYNLNGEREEVLKDLDSPLDLDTHPTLGLLILEPGKLFSSGGKVLAGDLEQATALETLPDGRVVVLEKDRIRLLHPVTGEEKFLNLPEDSTEPPKAAWRISGGLVWDPVRNQLFVSLPGIGEIRAVRLED